MTHKSLWAKHTLKHTHTSWGFPLRCTWWWKSRTLVHCPSNKDWCLPLLLQFIFVFVCVSRASQGDAEQLHVVCVCVSWQCTPSTPHPPSLVWTHGEPSSSFASYQSNWPNDKHTHTHKDTFTANTTSFVSWSKRSQMRSSTCTCLLSPNWCLCVFFFLHFMCVCSFVFVGFLCSFLYL